MGEFTINLEGKADPEKVRAAFEIAVRAVRGALEEAGVELEGELTVDGVEYAAGEVPEEGTEVDGSVTTP